jgi:UDP-glucose 4-epimerase
MAPAFATDLVRAHSAALQYLRNGHPSTILNCGYGRGYSVLEVIETVRRISGCQFRVDVAARRPGDPAQLVAAAGRARTLLDWQPKLDELPTIVSHALAWERRMIERSRS